VITAREAKRRATEHLVAEGSRWVVARATFDRRFSVWVIGYIDPDSPEDVLSGGGLVVTEDGEVHNVGSATGSLESLMSGLGRSFAADIAAVYAREGEGLALVADIDPDEAEGLAAWAASRRSVPEVPPASWSRQLAGEVQKQYWSELLSFVAKDREINDVFPPASETFAAFELTPYEDVRVVILGQDPYPNPGEAHGLAFSVPVGVRVPPSLRNIHKELNTDLGVPVPADGNLEGWAKQGVLLLNTALTVRAGSVDDRKVHRAWRWGRRGWQTFTDAVITALSASQERVVFLLWGADARAKEPLIDTSRHKVFVSVHPSPLSANRGGFFDTRPFSKANEALKAAGRSEIDWSKFRGTL
jgi:uracil-DNA glycosylase